MPNWCFNRLEVGGETADVAEFIEDNEAISEDGEKRLLDFESLSPIPADTDWYNWCITNWGTKWNANEVSRSMEDYMYGYSMATYSFDTAWSPPEGWLSVASRQYPMLEFHLSANEEGNGFWVSKVMKGGKETYSFYSEDVRDFCPEWNDDAEWGTDEADLQYETLVEAWANKEAEQGLQPKYDK